VVNWNILRCPACLGKGAIYEDRWDCGSCGRSYPRYGRVIDFRISDPRMDLSFAHETAKRKEIERIDRALDVARGGTLADMVSNYFAEFPTSKSIEEGEGRTLLSADVNAKKWLVQIEHDIPLGTLASRKDTAYLEVGCGAAGLTRTLGRTFQTAVAMDADIDRMMIAQKACEEAGIENAILVCAFGEQMPFSPATFDLISAVEVLEHVTSQRQFVQGIDSVLREGGYLYLTTPNRFSLGPEPHVNLWGVGFMPRCWMNRYVQFRIGLPYEGKRNLSYWELKRLLRGVFGTNARFSGAHPQSHSFLSRLANCLVEIPILRSVIQAIRMGHNVVVGKPAAAQ
jgi:2-polyprenyl-3-methyl-5-hydroxy-6-metoxy-1,4-benzoquinol methylase